MGIECAEREDVLIAMDAGLRELAAISDSPMCLSTFKRLCCKSKPMNRAHTDWSKITEDGICEILTFLVKKSRLQE